MSCPPPLTSPQGPPGSRPWDFAPWLALIHQGKQAEAHAYLSDTAPSHSNDAQRLHQIGSWLLLAGNPAAARPYWARAASLSAGDAKALANLAVIERLSGEHAAGIARMREAIALTPTDARLHGALGEWLGALGDVARAVEHLEQAIRLDPGNEAALGVLAKLMKGALPADGYRRWLQGLLTAHPHSARLWAELAECAAATGDRETEAASLDRAGRVLDDARCPRLVPAPPRMPGHGFEILILPVPVPHYPAIYGELITLLHDGLTALGHDVAVRVGLPDPDNGRRPIIIGTAFLARLKQAGLDPVVPEDAILFQSEHVHGPRHLVESATGGWLRHLTTWDFSAHNTAVARRLGARDWRWLRLGHTPALERLPPGADEDIDVLFYGALTPRRAAILQRLADRGLQVTAPRQACFGAARDALISRAKIVLNLHGQEGHALEHLRIVYPLLNGKCVVSEPSNPEDDGTVEDAVVFATADRLADVCAEYAADRGRRLTQGEKARARLKSRPMTAILPGML